MGQRKYLKKKYTHEHEQKFKYNISKYVNTAKAVLSGKFMAHTRNEERSQINIQISTSKNKEKKKEQINPKEVEGNKDRNTGY